MGRKRLFITILLSLTIVCGLKFLFASPKPIKLSFKTTLNKPVEFQVFYTSSSKESFSEKRSLKRKIQAGSNQKVIFKLPAKKIKRLRLDFGSNPGEILIRRLQLQGLWTQKIRNFEGSYNQIDSFTSDKGKLLILSEQKDPYLFFKKKFNLPHGYQIDWKVLVILITLAFLISYKTVDYLAQFKILENHSRIDIVFLSVFFLVLFIPVGNINQDKISVQENRVLATYKPLWNGQKINYNFGRDFEQWFNDRFVSRNLLIGSYSLAQNYINRKSMSDRVFEAKDGWLFYLGDDSASNYQNKNLLSDKCLQNITGYLSELQKWCNKNNKKFYLFLAPDKNKIYGEYYKYFHKIRDDNQSRANQLIAYLKERTDIKVIYPYEFLHKHKKDGLLYYKNDTHWNELGAYWGYNQLITTIAHDFPDINVYKYSNLRKINKKTGDLTNMYPKEIRKEDLQTYFIPELITNFDCKVSIAKRIDNTCISAKSKKYKAFLLRDSFMTFLAPYLAQSFKQIELRWRYNFTKEDLKKMKESDVLIIEMVERYIPKLCGLTFPNN